MIDIIEFESINNIISFIKKRKDTSSIRRGVEDIISNVRSFGDKALRDYTLEFDKVHLEDFKVSKEEINKAYEEVDADFIDILKESYKNILSYHENQKKTSYIYNKELGVFMGQRLIPVDSAAIYVPGGKAAYPSSVLMNAIPAIVAGVNDISIVTPPDKNGKVKNSILAAAKICGIYNIYKLGGAQAIAALAYGTESINAVSMIVGPGNAFVAEAKRQVFGDVGIDMVAGPSEILIIADDNANAKYIAADLMSQAEHDELASSILVTTSKELAEKVNKEIIYQVKELSRKNIIESSLRNYGKIIISKSIKESINIANIISPEHLELLVSNPMEYFLLENRQREIWDTYIPGHGMLVWHIDFDSNKWFYNTVNNTANHQCVDIIEADNTATSQTRPGDTFPGTSSVFEFTSKSRPAFRNWKNEAIDYPITEISESVDGVISFKIKGGGDETSPYYLPAPKVKVTAVDSESFKLEWDAVDVAEGYMLTVYAFEDSDGSELYGHVGDYLTKDIGDITSIEIEDLDSDTAYVIRLYAYNRYNMSSASEMNVSTISEDMEDSSPLINTEKIGSDKVDLWWTSLKDAEYYELTVATRTVGESAESETASFDGKKLPSSQWFSFGGWETRTGYFGESAPSLKFSSNGDMIESPVYDKDIKSVELWSRFSREDISARLEVYGSDGVSKYHIATITEIAGDEEGTRLSIDNIPYGTRQITLTYYFASKDAILYVDDIKINFAGEVVDTPVAGYENLRVDGTNCTVSGLNKLTEYVAYVRAVGGGVESKYSRPVSFKTTDPASVNSVVDNSLAIRLSNGVVSLSDFSEMFSVYSIDGRVIALNVAGEFRLPHNGMFIVKAGSKVAKVNW